MGTCDYCGSAFPKTRATRKYCTPRCKTNACLERKPRRMRAAAVAAIYDLLGEDFLTVEAFRERLRRIVAPNHPGVPLAGGRPVIPRLD
jgi:hypothetical protein